MTPQEQADNILRLQANIVADVELNKNLEKHLNEVQGSIDAITQRIDDGIINKIDISAWYEQGFFMYQLRDRIIDKLNGKNL